ncbi:MAG TPA: AraC family transcriptional regulator [Candidatus Rubrimentiphilum sp.]|nr:AraC family transcriptional regulator [Candidatus Rubrimentiphilum sp.]
MKNRPHRHGHDIFGTTVRGCTADWESGTSVLIPAGDKHFDEIGPTGCQQIIVEFRPRAFEIGDPARRRQAASPELFHLARALQRALIWEGRNDPFVRSIIHELLASDFVQGASTKRSRATWLRHANEYIEEHFRMRPSLETIANAVGVHPVHLAREYRRRYQVTIAQTVRRRVISEALSLITKSHMPALVVAGQYGYTASHFSQLLQRETGCNLKQLRAISNTSPATRRCVRARRSGPRA